MTASDWLAFHKQRPPSHDGGTVGFLPGHPLYSGPVGREGDSATEKPPVVPLDKRRKPTVFYRGVPLDATLAQFHVAIDMLMNDTVPKPYYDKVVAGRRKKKVS